MSRWGSILTGIGGISMAIIGLIRLFGYRPLTWYDGLTGVVLGVGLLLFVLPGLTKED